MVKAFGAEVQQSNDPSYIGYSKEGDADVSLKKLFSGLASVIDLKSNFYEEQEKETAEAKGDEIVNAPVAGADAEPKLVKDDAGETTTDTFGGETNSQADVDAKTIVQKGGKLREAYAEGRVSESYYWSQMDAMVKQAKARYPGPLGRKIEAAVTSALGSRPASRAVEAAREEYKSSLASANEEEKKFNSFVDTNIKFLPPDYFSRQKEGRPYTKIETRAYVQDQQQEDLKYDRQKTQLSLAKERGNLNEEEATGTALQEVTGFVNRILVNTADVGGAGGEKFTKLLRNAQEKGKDLNPDEQMQLRSAFADLRLKVSEGVESILNKTWADNKSSYYNTIRSPEKLNNIKKQAMDRIAQYEQFINDKDYGLLNADINRTKALKDEANRVVLESSDQLRIWQAIKEQGGDALLNEFYTSPEGTKMKNTAIKAFRDIKLAERMAGESSSLQEDIKTTKNLSAPAKDKAQLNFQMIKDSVTTLTSDKATPDIQSHTARYLFGPKNADFLSQVKPSQATDIYTRLVSPEVTKKMLQIKEHDAEAWNLYKQWATDSFGSLFKNLVSSVQEGATARPWLNVKWDAKANQFVVSDTEKSPRGKPLQFGGVIPRVIETAFTVGTERSIAELNRQIKVLEPILKADNYEVGEEMLGLFNAMGVDEMAPKEASFFAKLRDSLSQSYKDEQGGDRTTADGKK